MLEKKEAKETKWTEEKTGTYGQNGANCHTRFQRKEVECDDLIDIGIFYRFQ
jgi:hypothetical protein